MMLLIPNVAITRKLIKDISKLPSFILVKLFETTKAVQFTKHELIFYFHSERLKQLTCKYFL